MITVFIKTEQGGSGKVEEFKDIFIWQAPVYRNNTDPGASNEKVSGFSMWLQRIKAVIWSPTLLLTVSENNPKSTSPD